IMNAHKDTAGINRVDNPATTGNHTDTGVARYVALHPGPHQRLVRTQGRHSLTLHVGTHQRAVGVVVFEERNQRSSNRNNLLGRYVHQGDVFRRLDGELVQMAYGNQLVDQFAAVQLGTGLGNYVVGLFDSREEYDFVGDFAIFDYAVRAFQEAVLIGAGVGGQRVDQADVRTFRRFDRAHAAVMGRVYVTNFEACTLTGQTARAERRDATLVGNLRQRVVLVHELRELAGTEELFHRRRNWFGVDQVLRHQAFAFGHRQAFLDRTLDTHQTYTELVLGHFADATYAA